MGLLDGKVVLITGGARGQGRAHAVTSAREGAAVVVVDIAGQIDTVPYPMATPDDLDETVRQVQAVGGRALPIQGDVRSQADLDDAVAAAIAEFGRLDALVVNHGIISMAPFWQLTEDQWDDVLAVNLTGVWKTIKAATPHMIGRGSGSIVVTSSVNGLEAGFNYGHYAVSKHGVIGLVKNVALELAPHGVRCNCVAPANTATPMVLNQAVLDVFAGGPGGTPDDLARASSHYHALRGAGTLEPERIADAALWLNSDLASAVTGVTVPVDAGHLLLTGYNQAPAR